MPAGLLEGLAKALDPDAEIRLLIDFRDNLAFCSAARDETPSGFLQKPVEVRDFLYPWLELTMSTVSGRILRLKIERSGEVRQTGHGRKRTSVTTFQDFALLHIEDPSRPEAESQSRSVPISKAFASLSSTTTGRTVSIEAVSQRQADNAESKLFEASDLTALFVEALAEGQSAR